MERAFVAANGRCMNGVVADRMTVIDENSKRCDCARIFLFKNQQCERFYKMLLKPSNVINA